MSKTTTKWPRIFFVLGIVIILFIPIAKVAVDLDTFIHPWRPELATAIFVIGFGVWSLFDCEFQVFVIRLPKAEKFGILIPVLLFAFWSGLSSVWAASWTSALHHTTVWVAYIAVYLLARFFVSKRQTGTALIVGAICFLAIISLPMLVEYYSFVIAGNGTSIGLRYSKYTEITNVLLPLLAAFTVSSKGWRMIGGTLAVIIVGLFDVASLSRTGVIVFVFVITSFVLVVFVFKSIRVYRRSTAILFVTVAAALILSNVFVAATEGNVPVIARAQEAGAEDSTNIRPLLGNIAREMWLSHPVIGVGADNFGQRFVEFRGAYATRHATDKNLILAEDARAERAHNEYLQILAELGLVGIGLIAWFGCGVIYAAFDLILRKRRYSIYTYAAFIGLVAFSISSFVTSYSFRIVQNGVVFWVVLAIAIGGTIGRRRTTATDSNEPSFAIVRTGIVISVLSCMALAWFCIYRVLAVEYVLATNSLPTFDERRPIIENAIAIDPENGGIQASYGRVLLNLGHANDAIPHLREAIRVGQATSIDYSYLATALIIANDRASAESTIAEALKAYPYSVFLRTRRAVILKDLGRQPESDAEFTRALAINDGQAHSWWNFIEKGGAVAAKLAYEGNLPPLAELLPGKAIYAIKTERELRFPEEKFKLPMPNE
jgi:O-antigen ligase